MKLNEKQTHALEEIYRVARMYTKIAAELNKVADTIELESEKNDEEFMKVFGVSQGYYMNDIVRVFDNLPEHAHEQIGELIIAFKKWLFLFHFAKIASSITREINDSRKEKRYDHQQNFKQD